MNIESLFKLKKVLDMNPVVDVRRTIAMKPFGDYAEPGAGELLLRFACPGCGTVKCVPSSQVEIDCRDCCGWQGVLEAGIFTPTGEFNET